MAVLVLYDKLDSLGLTEIVFGSQNSLAFYPGASTSTYD